MICSNNRKLSLSGCLKNIRPNEYDSPLKLQKFLFFYEAFSKIDGEKADFTYLKGYKRGPVFSQVWGDYTRERTEFNILAEKSYQEKKENIDIDRVNRCAFIISTLTEKELSMLTHEMNIWKAKKIPIMRGDYQVPLSEKDFNLADEQMLRLLEQMNPADKIIDSEIINLDNYYFVFKKNDISKLTERHLDILSTLTEKEELHNPVYVEIDERGRLLID